MSAVSSVMPVYDLSASGEYLTLGAGEKKTGHASAGTDRVAYFYCDEPDIESFIARGDQLANRYGRRVKAHSYVISFSPDVLDVNNPDDVQYGGDIAFLLAKRMRPNSSALVVGHADQSCVHAHIQILNHDNLSRKAPRDYRVHWQVKRANDALLREQGMDVVEPRHKVSQASYWTQRRGEQAGFEQMLGDAIDGALADPKVMDMKSFRAVCAGRGVQVEEKRYKVKTDGYRGLSAGDEAVGLVYKMRDTTSVSEGRKPRLRRRAAGKLSPDFTTDGLAAVFEAKTQTKRMKTVKPAPQYAGSVEPIPDQRREDFEPAAARFTRKLAARKPKTPARARHLASRHPQFSRQRDRTFGD